MPLQSDRGYVAITDLPDGTKNVNIYARSNKHGPSHRFASYQGLRNVVVDSDVPFRTWEDGGLSDDVLEVTFDLEDGRLYVRDPADLSTSLE